MYPRLQVGKKRTIWISIHLITACVAWFEKKLTRKEKYLTPFFFCWKYKTETTNRNNFQNTLRNMEMFDFNNGKTTITHSALIHVASWRRVLLLKFHKKNINKIRLRLKRKLSTFAVNYQSSSELTPPLLLPSM